MSRSAIASYLVPVEGPSLPPLTLRWGEANVTMLTLGRHQDCQLRLPMSAEQTSRFHCRLRYESGQWRIADLSSRRGTFVNGVKLYPEQEIALLEGDLIRIEPWTFELCGMLDRRGLLSDDDGGVSAVRTFLASAAPRARLDAEYLGLLLTASTAINAAADEKKLAESVLDAAIRGTGLSNAAVLRSLDSAGHVDVVASRIGRKGDSAAFKFSRSLIGAAAGGQIAEVSGHDMPATSQSLVSMKVTAALCVPLMLGPSTLFYLYLDARSERPGAHGRQPLRPDAIAFVTALGQLASLALANLKRIEMERRQMWLDKELLDAREAQRWILPQRRLEIGPYICAGESKSGQSLGGDFFELIDLGDGKLAVALGDVAGKGIVASVLMTATLGYLHASLRHFADPGKAVTALNDYIAPRRSSDRFVTLWVGVLDTVSGELRYVDAGHGYAFMIHGDRSIVQLNAGNGPILGVEEGFEFEAQVVPVPSCGTVLVMSDGIVEQPAQLLARDTSTARRPFDIEGVTRAIANADTDDLVAALFDSVIAHAGTSQLSDDATIVSATWNRAHQAAI